MGQQLNAVFTSTRNHHKTLENTTF
jgi:hypothetical protein